MSFMKPVVIVVENYLAMEVTKSGSMSGSPNMDKRMMYAER